jgi:hypothetical protein
MVFNPQTNIEIAERCDQQTMRIEKILHIGAMAGDCNAVASDMEDAIHDGEFEEDEELLSEQLPWLSEAMGDAPAFATLAFENGHLGFLIKAAQPVIDPEDVHSDGKGYRVRWNCYRTRWFYGETFAEAVADAESWASTNIDNALAAAKSSQDVTDVG